MAPMIFQRAFERCSFHPDHVVAPPTKWISISSYLTDAMSNTELYPTKFELTNNLLIYKRYAPVVWFIKEDVHYSSILI